MSKNKRYQIVNGKLSNQKSIEVNYHYMHFTRHLYIYMSNLRELFLNGIIDMYEIDKRLSGIEKEKQILSENLIQVCLMLDEECPAQPEKIKIKTIEEAMKNNYNDTAKIDVTKDLTMSYYFSAQEQGIVLQNHCSKEEMHKFKDLLIKSLDLLTKAESELEFMKSQADI